MFGSLVGREWSWHSHMCLCWQISGKNLESPMIICISSSCHVHTLNSIFFSTLTPVHMYSSGEIWSIKSQLLIMPHKTCKGILMINLRWNLELHHIRHVHACSSSCFLSSLLLTVFWPPFPHEDPWYELTEFLRFWSPDYKPFRDWESCHAIVFLRV